MATRRTLVRLTAAIVAGDWERLAELRRTAGDGEPDAAWREAVLQSHLFAGFPRVVEACEVIEREGGLGQPGAEETGWSPDRAERGRELFHSISRDQTAAVRDKLRGHHPVLLAWIEGHAYGRVLTRPGLSPKRRELLACAALATLGQDRQLTSHVRGARNLGATPEDVLATLDAIADIACPERLERARRTVSDCLRR